MFLARNYCGEIPINIGSGDQVSIGGLARLICRTVGFESKLSFDTSRPDGTQRKLSDTRRLHELGWNRARPLEQGLSETYASWTSDRAHGNGSTTVYAGELWYHKVGTTDPCI